MLPESTIQTLFDNDNLALDDLTPLCTPYHRAWSPEDAQANDALLHFSIMDTGPGMSLDEQGRIFKRYAQASPKTYKSFGGVGLGLWISRRLIELHGGTVSLQSIEGVGTIFRLYIKVQRKQNIPVQPPLLSPPSGERTPLAEAPMAGDTVSAPLPVAVEESRWPVKIEGRKPIVLAVEGEFKRTGGFLPHKLKHGDDLRQRAQSEDSHQASDRHEVRSPLCNRWYYRLGEDRRITRAGQVSGHHPL